MDLGDKMKKFEAVFDQFLLPETPYVVRLDGKAFHTYTKGLKRPFDERLHKLMTETTKFLVKETKADLGYTQSDEISLIFEGQEDNQYGGRVNKLNSVFSSLSTYFFNKNVEKLLPEKADKVALFDCRTFNIPDKVNLWKYIYWRERDATKNSISMAAQSVYSDKELFKKNSSDKQEMLFQKGINWNDYPSWAKRGSYVKTVVIKKVFTNEEIEKLPERHLARQSPGVPFIRTETVRVECPPFAQITNKDGFVFRGELPESGIDD